ncbi:MAG: hypothetical protein Q9218_008107, partial [Villophora microphyllina]
AYLADFNASQPPKKRRAPSDTSVRQDDEVSPGGLVEDPLPSASQQSTALRRLVPAPGCPPSKSAAVTSPKSAPGRKREPKPTHRKDSSPAQLGQGIASHRYSHACESCKRKKLKCDGAIPTCSRCSKSEGECLYEGGIRDREKRLVEDMAGKLGAYEETLRRIKPELGNDDQSEISQLLLTSPQSDYKRTVSSGQASGSTQNESADGLDYESGGESDASGVGSMGSTDHLNEDYFAMESGPGRIDSFLGQTATDNWVGRLKDSLDLSKTDEVSGVEHQSAGHVVGPQNHGGSGRPDVAEGDAPRSAMPMFIDHCNPYELPSRSSADTFVDAYFYTVHPAFPILSRAQFLQNYEQVYSSTNQSREPSSSFVILHLVLAIGAIHSFATQVPWARKERYHLLNFALAKATVVDASVSLALAYEQAQLCGLGGLYFLMTYEINRAWNVAGLGVRCAQALGLHLTNVTPQMTGSQKNLRLGIWYSLLSLERTMTVITGRPSMIRDVDCSATLPPEGLEDPDKHVRKAMPRANSHLWSRAGDASGRALWSHQEKPVATVDSMFFVHFVELSSMADNALSSLYNARSRRTKWSELQGMIEKLSRKLDDWNANLPHSFQTNWSRQKPEGHSSRVAIGMLYHSTSIIINRPCLCRLDRRIAHQSAASNQTNIASANRCVSSARSILALVPNPPDPAMIYQGPLWWMALHHLKRATTVLMLEMTFMSSHTAEADADILIDAKKAIAWLHALGQSSSPAYSSWITLSRLLVRAAEKFGGDLSDAIIAGDDEDPASDAKDHAAAAEGEQQMADVAFNAYDPTVFGADQGRGGGDVFGGDLALEGWDQFEPDMASLDEIDRLM